MRIYEFSKDNDKYVLYDNYNNINHIKIANDNGVIVITNNMGLLIENEDKDAAKIDIELCGTKYFDYRYFDE